MSTPSSAIALTTAGLTSSPGSLPAERTWTRPSDRNVTSAAAIWLRPALWTQMNEHLGLALHDLPLDLGKGPEPFSREAVCKDRDENVDPRSPKQVDGFGDVPADRFLREDSSELSGEGFGRLIDVALRDWVEDLGHPVTSVNR